MRNMIAAVLATLAAVVVLAAPASAYASVGNDYQMVCESLDNTPTVEGLAAIGRVLMGRGMSARDSGEIIGQAAAEQCIQHLPVLDEFMATQKATLSSVGIPYCDGTHSPCYCPDDGGWHINAWANCPRVWTGPQLPGENDGDSIWDGR